MSLAPLSPWSGEHADAAAEEAFRREQLDNRRHQSRQLVLAASLVFFGFILSDLALEGMGPVFSLKAACRLLVLGIGLAAFAALASAATPRRVTAWLAAWHVAVTISSAVIFAITVPSPETARVSAILMVLVAYLAVPLPFTWKVVLTAASSVLFAVALWLPAPDATLYANFVAMLLASNVFGAIAAAAGNRLQRQQHQAVLAERAARRQQAHSDTLLERLFEAAPVPLLISSVSEGHLLRLNQAALDLLRWQENPSAGVTTPDLYVDVNDRKRLIALVREQGTASGFETRLRLPDGREMDVLIGASLISYAGEECLMAGITDITEHKRMADELRRMAVTDQLTLLPNRHFFFAQAHKEVERARRYGRPLGVLMLDLDHFKAVNDTHGHEAGDVVLRAFADRCRGLLRDADTMARFGGEEFVVLLPETNLAGTAILAERLRQGVAAEPIRHRQASIRLTISVGATLVAAEEESIDAAIARADRALLRAKAAGRNRVVVVDADDEASAPGAPSEPR